MGASTPPEIPFGFDTTAAEVLAGVDLSGRRAIVTGANSGIGAATARALAAAGAEVTLAVRDLVAAAAVVAELGDAGGRCRIAPLDLVDLDSVAAFGDSWEGPLDALVLNAGIMLPDLRRAPGSGWELQFAVNHLGHFALATGLHRHLAAAGGRVVAVSSGAHLAADVDFDDIHFERRPYETLAAYGQSKTANVLFAVAAAERWRADGIVANAARPGTVASGLMRHTGFEQAIEFAGGKPGEPGTAWKSAEGGAATSVLLAASPLVEGVSGAYFDDCRPAPVVEPGTGPGVASYAVDPTAAERLWALSTRLTSR
jgi:NAD(P)-dependent dehydrogenase (short-subunit alcohol dehydrogenase family)